MELAVREMDGLEGKLKKIKSFLQSRKDTYKLHEH
jgi:hypothetical protein